MSKVIKESRDQHITSLPISKFINSRYRDYAVYVLEQRGIPSFYDALTPVQRYILMNSPSSYQKTLSVVGKSIEAGYHHGNCLAYDTKINLSDGSQVTIGEWHDNERDRNKIVKSVNSYITEKLGWGHSPRIGQETNEYLEVCLENGEIIKCTFKHPFLVVRTNTVWIDADMLNVGDVLFSLKHNQTIKQINKIISKEPVKFYDITVNLFHNFSITDSEIIVHNSALEGAIAKLARPFGCAMQVLEGYVFFGSEVCPDPAAPRDTSVKISNNANDILKKYKHLTKKEPEGAYEPFWMDVPLGLTLPIVGISVGYKTTILPRKLEDIQAYLRGDIKSLKPSFMDFTGSIQKYQGAKNSWLISSNITISGNRMEVRSIPPILRYSSVLKRLDWLITKYESNIRILNNSNTKVCIDVVYLGKKQDEWKEIQDFVKKVFSVLVAESPVFIKDEQVLVYDSIEQYLDDYKWQVKRLLYNQNLYEKNFLSKELEFNKAKKEFVNFMLVKKRSIEEVDVFLGPFENDTKDRLERLTSKKFTKDELLQTDAKIKELEKDLKTKIKELDTSKKDFERMEDPTLKRGISSKKVIADLFNIDDISMIDGIYVWGGEDVLEEEIVGDGE